MVKQKYSVMIKTRLRKRHDARVRKRAYDRMFNMIDFMIATLTVKKASTPDYVKGVVATKTYLKNQIMIIYDELKKHEQNILDEEEDKT